MHVIVVINLCFTYSYSSKESDFAIQ